MNLKLRIENAASETLMTSEPGDETWMLYEPAYAEGDSIVLESDETECFAWIQLDDAMPPALVYIKEREFRLPVPMGEGKASYSPRAFSGSCHLIHARTVPAPEDRHNLSFNPYDTHGAPSLFPHASANVETRNESVFAARNAIDGSVANSFHGEWPHTSWGINQNPEACLKIEFGRKVIAEEAVVYLRADFPHDAWWTSGCLSFSDGSSVTLEFKKTGAAQKTCFPPRLVEWVTLDNLIKADDPSPFPALTQLEIHGRES
ncbi:MAG: carbohydrate-binding protein [Spirochaetales bacterium]|nr:carbohydrate-binding protein [Spirochaetales bacterium]